MNIRTKMISLLALLFAVLIVLEIVVQKQVLMPSFAQLEREDAETSMKRIGYALDTDAREHGIVGRGLGQLGGRLSISCRRRMRRS